MRVDSWTLPIVRGDRYVLCSDGLVDEVIDDDIASRARSRPTIRRTPPTSWSRRQRAGGRDNITVVVVDVLEGLDPPDPDRKSSTSSRPGRRRRWQGADVDVDTGRVRTRHDPPVDCRHPARRRPLCRRRGAPQAQPLPCLPRRRRRRRRARRRVHDPRRMGTRRLLRRVQRATARSSSTRVAPAACCGSIRPIEAVTQFSRDELDDDSIALVERRVCASNRSATPPSSSPGAGSRPPRRRRPRPPRPPPRRRPRPRPTTVAAHDRRRGTLTAATIVRRRLPGSPGRPPHHRARRCVVHGGLITGVRLHGRVARRNAVIPARLVPFLAIVLGLRRCRPHRRAAARPRRRRHAAAARRTAARHRLRDDHPPRRTARRAADHVEPRGHRARSSPRCSSSSGRPTWRATSGRSSSSAPGC